MCNYSNVFALDASELGTTDIVKHTVDISDHSPIKQPLRKTPFAFRAKMDEPVQEMLSQGAIEQSKSTWPSPVVLVSKKDGGLHFCINDWQLKSQSWTSFRYPEWMIPSTSWLEPSFHNIGSRCGLLTSGNGS